MKVPLSWLKDFVDIDESIETLCEKMVAIGLEIEEVKYLGENVTNVKICRITEIAQHPNAERLLCCKVDIGGEIIPIVTNDHRVKIGDKVPVALHNANLANGLHITKGKMRGEESWGMFCGAEELGITKDFYAGADADGVLVLSPDAEIGGNVCAEVGLDDYVLDVCVTSNRQDCNSVLGLAREVAVALGKTCREPDVSYREIGVDTTSLVKVDVAANDVCSGYFMQGLTDVKIAPSPVWMTRRLAKVGLHGINNIVDITNYVLFEIGQPMHSFDCDDLTDKTIVVRRAQDGEKIVPLDGKEYALGNDDIVIADKTRVVGLAGIMGGANSGVKNTTNCVMLESATFARGNVRRTSRRLGLRSDSSARFEKGIETYTNNLGLSRALHLAEQIGCGKVTKGRISVGEVARERNVKFGKERIKRLLGIEIADDKILSILKLLNIDAKIEKNTVICIVPPYRDDLVRDCDIVEELIRVYGYDNINGTLLDNCQITCGGKTEKAKKCDTVREILSGMGYSECIFYPFGGKSLFEKASLVSVEENKYIRIKNPIGEELSLMNLSLAPNMLQCVALNLSRKVMGLKFFEIGKTYEAEILPLRSLPKEVQKVSVCATDIDFDEFRKTVLRLVHAFACGDIKLVRSENSELLHPGISAEVLINGECCGAFGKIHPQIAKNFGINVEVAYAELDFDKLTANKSEEIKFENFGKFPSISRDFAFVCDESVPAQEILNEFLALSYVCDAHLFDVYRGEQLGADKKSLAISVEFRDNNRTLQDADIEKQVGRALKNIKDKYDATLR
ncbi:MAG: phenylalanine--tRNA ligase subunit beta [Corallococcus sp.]|nr:phenylalanine--tRNA ligase subunit beta [Corallococcus sp.]MCM1359181.1 phenylalanine--tRNA ligase subunit beta [Corallococcus sp.]MCM1394571.1 phenylalanine--tRNA ligase subunit beta [Corallococcus sp.]